LIFLLFIGVSLLMKYRHYSLFFSQTYILLPVVFTTCSAAFLFIPATFVYLLVVIFCLGSTASALAYVHSRKVLHLHKSSLSEVFQKYTGSSRDRNSRIVDVTQEELHCCGVRNYTDWLDSSWFNKTAGDAVPHSCCNSTFLSCKGSVYQPWQLYHQVDKTASIMFIMWACLLGFLTEISSLACWSLCKVAENEKHVLLPASLETVGLKGCCFTPWQRHRY
uniref:Tetraspanin 37 n=1 Tax=Xiphophorus maculatus TaxID=8083 RepID=A0A3B5Q0D0_XIPMA